jgi:hypothetical protein
MIKMELKRLYSGSDKKKWLPKKLTFRQPLLRLD